MTTLRSWVRVALALLVFLSVANCAEQQSGDGRQSGDVRGAPINQQDDVEAPGAPIAVPTISFARQPSLDEAREAIEQSIRQQCGGELCVRLVVERRDLDGVTSCDYAGLEPAPGTRVERGSTIVIVSGTQPCDGPTTDPPEPTDEGDGADEHDDGPEEPTEADDVETDDEPAQPPSTP